MSVHGVFVVNKATFILILLLVLNCFSDAGAETSVSTSTTNGATKASTSFAKKPYTERESIPAEVLLTINGPAKEKVEEKNGVVAGSAAVQNPTGQPAPKSTRQLAQRVPNLPGEFGLSALATELAKQWNVYNRIVELDAAYRQWKSTHSTEDTIKYLIAKQTILADLSDLIFDVRRCTNAIDREIATNSSKAAHIAELRDRAIRFNTYADFVAGGLTGVIAGALEMANLTRFANTSVDIAEGAGQMGLSAWAFKAEHAGDRKQGGLPNVLAGVVDPNYHHKAYPESVRKFLNTPENNSGTTRLDAMLKRWTQLNFCLTHSGHRMGNNKRLKHLTGTHTEDATATIDLLEDRTAMLHDLRSEVTMMDETVAELFDLAKRY